MAIQVDTWVMCIPLMTSDVLHLLVQRIIYSSPLPTFDIGCFSSLLSCRSSFDSLDINLVSISPHFMGFFSFFDSSFHTQKFLILMKPHLSVFLFLLPLLLSYPSLQLFRANSQKNQVSNINMNTSWSLECSPKDKLEWDKMIN